MRFKYVLMPFLFAHFPFSYHFSLFVMPDINECSEDPCHAHAQCSNNNGSFQCRCNPGYQGTGFLCTGNPLHYENKTFIDVLRCSLCIELVGFHFKSMK